MFHTRQRFTYKGHAVDIGVEVVVCSPDSASNTSPTFIKTPAIYIDHVKMNLDADALTTLREDALSTMARQFIEALPQQPARKLPLRTFPGYLWEQCKRTGLNIAAVGMLLAAVIMGIVLLLIILLLGVLIGDGQNYTNSFAVGVTVLGLMAGICISGVIGVKSLKHAQKIEPGILVTSHELAHMPASDSLVRASQEPPQAQEGVLLRAASGEAQAGQEGQLLRASVGGE